MLQQHFQSLKKSILIWISSIASVVPALEEAIILFPRVLQKWLLKREA
jgi:hypothetical protein